MVKIAIHLDQSRLAEICRRHRVARLSLFGSVLTDRFGPESDVDVLVEFAPDAQPTFLDLAGLEVELAELFGRRVDARTPRELSRYFRNRVLAEAMVQDAA